MRGIGGLMRDCCNLQMRLSSVGTCAAIRAARESAKLLTNVLAPSLVRLHLRAPIAYWTHWGLNPGPSAREADVIPLHHVPLDGLA